MSGYVSVRCADCAADVLHCHGTLIIHRSGEVECSCDVCVGAWTEETHGDVIDCIELHCTCG